MVAVLPGVALTRARPFCWNRALMREDLPTLERPANTTSGVPEGGSCPAVPKEVRKVTL